MSTKDRIAAEVEGATEGKRRADWNTSKKAILAKTEGKVLEEDEYLNTSGEVVKDKPQDIEIEDLCLPVLDGSGEVTKWIFSPSRSRNALLRRYRLLMEITNDKKIWGYNNHTGVWVDSATPFLLNELYEKAGDVATKFKVAEVVDRLKAKLQTEPVTFNEDPFLMPLKNGVINLREGAGSFRPLESDDHVTFLYNAKWDPDNADWRPFLWFLCSSLPDPADVLTALDITTAIALRVPFDVICLLFGGGSNGKGIFERVLQALFTPKRSTAIELGELKRSRFGPGALLNKDLWIVSEVESAKDATSALKKIATGELLDVDVKYGDRVQGRPHVIPILDANNAFEFGDDSYGKKRRINRLDFCYTFGDDPGMRPMDRHLEEKLTRPEVLSGIVQIIAARGPALAQSRRIMTRKGAELQDQEYKRQLYSLHYFCDECLDEGSDGFEVRLTSDEVYEAYLEYCKLYSVPTPSARAPFGKYLKERFGVKSERTSTIVDGETKYIRYYPGLYIIKSPKVAYAELHTDYASICQDMPALCQEWVKDNGVTLSVMPAMPANHILSCVIEEIKRMYKYIQSCEDNSQITYKRYVDQFAGIAGIAGINNSKHTSKENSSRHNAGIVPGIAGIVSPKYPPSSEMEQTLSEMERTGDSYNEEAFQLEFELESVDAARNILRSHGWKKDKGPLWYPPSRMSQNSGVS